MEIDVFSERDAKAELGLWSDRFQITAGDICWGIRDWMTQR